MIVQPTDGGAAGKLVDRVRREQLLACLASGLAASVHLAFVAGIVRGSVVFVVASALAVVIGRFFRVQDGVDLASLPRRTGWAVFRGSLSSLGIAILGIEAFDSEAGLAFAAGRSFAGAGLACSSLGALVVYHRTRLRCDRFDPDRRRRAGSMSDLAAAEPWTRTLARQLRIVVGGAALAGGWLLADGVVQALAQGWGPARIVAAVGVFAAGCLWLTGLLARGFAAELKQAVEDLRVEAARIESRTGDGLIAGIEALGSGMNRGEELTRALVHQRDQQSIEHAHVERLVQGLGARTEPALQRVGELVARLESSRHATTAAVVDVEIFDEHARQLETEVQASLHWLESLDRGDRALGALVEQISASTRETGSELAELARVTRGVETASESTSEFARDVLARAEIGRAKFAATVAGIEAIRTATASAESVIRGLGTRTQEIGGILDVIDDVGDQTSLLALNAAIIAAQAGEQGRAFSVVADEIRDLADRVLVSTKEIGSLIRAVQSESERAIDAIEAGSGSVSMGLALSAEAGRTLDEIAAIARETGPRFEAVVATARSRPATVQKIVEVVGTLEVAVSELAAASRAREGDREGAVRGIRALRGTTGEMRTSVREHSARITHRDGDLGTAIDDARSIAVVLENQAQGCRDLGHVIEVGAERQQSLRAVDEALAVAQTSLRAQVDTLRTASRRSAGQATSPGPMARTTGVRT